MLTGVTLPPSWTRWTDLMVWKPSPQELKALTWMRAMTARLCEPMMTSRHPYFHLSDLKQPCLPPLALVTRQLTGQIRLHHLSLCEHHTVLSPNKSAPGDKSPTTYGIPHLKHFASEDVSNTHPSVFLFFFLFSSGISGSYIAVSWIRSCVQGLMTSARLISFGRASQIR